LSAVAVGSFCFVQKGGPSIVAIPVEAAITITAGELLFNDEATPGAATGLLFGP
jgi:hypothetical protein